MESDLNYDEIEYFLDSLESKVRVPEGYQFTLPLIFD